MYLHTMGDTIEQDIQTTIELLRGKKFDAIAVRGMSGMLIGPAVAARLGKDLIVVRKCKDGSHSASIVEGVDNWNHDFRYIIVDDFIDSGETLSQIFTQIVIELEDMDISARCAGVVLYNHLAFYTFTQALGQSSCGLVERLRVRDNLIRTWINSNNRKKQNMTMIGKASSSD